MGGRRAKRWNLYKVLNEGLANLDFLFKITSVTFGIGVESWRRFAYNPGRMMCLRGGNFHNL